MQELTDEQIERQDFVDNAIYHLIQEVNPAGKTIEWDIEMIGDVRGVIREWLVEKMNIASRCFIRIYRSEMRDVFCQFNFVN